MVREIVTALNIRAEGHYIDATFGRGGHTEAILQRLGPGGRVVALDRDPQAVAAGRARFGGEPRVTVVHSNFIELEDAVAVVLGPAARVDGIVFDLGVSSPQLDDPGRGFSFTADGPLDMRMDTTTGPDAAAWIADVEEEELARVIREFGEDRYARRIAGAIVAARAQAPINTTGELSRIVAAAVPTREPGKHPATRTFLALRLFMNRELEAVQMALPRAVRLLKQGGRLVVISFHSLEDRIVKRFMRAMSHGDTYPAKLPIPAQLLHPLLRQIGKAIRPGAEEVARNPRARSAVLRVAERTEFDHA